MNVDIIANTTERAAVNIPSGYIIGAILALCILGYLFYSLVKPEKF